MSVSLVVRCEYRLTVSHTHIYVKRWSFLPHLYQYGKREIARETETKREVVVVTGKRDVLDYVYIGWVLLIRPASIESCR